MNLPARAKHLLRVLSARENAGVAAIEFAFLTTVLMTILAGIIDVGRLLYTEFELDTAVSAGAQYALNNASMVGSSPGTLSSNISSIVDNLNGSGWATSTVNVNNSDDATHCYCPSGSPGNWTWGSTVSCGSACASGTGVGGQFVTIVANRSITPIISYFGFVKSGEVSRSVIVETE